MKYLAYILRQTGKNFRHTWGTQVLTLLTVTLSVLIFSFFFLVYTNMISAGKRLGEDVRLIVYLDEEIVPQLRPEVEKKIRAFNEVEKIVFISRAEAFEILKEQLGEEKDVLDDLGPDFLPPSIEVYPLKTLKSLTTLAKFSEYLLTLPGVSKVQYGREWLERFGHFTNLIQIIVFLSGGLLVFSMTFIIAYTIRLTVDSRQSELEILRLLGATSSYVRIPLLLEGLFQGLLGSALGLAALYALYNWVSTRFSGPVFLQIFDISFFSPTVTISILLGSILLCTGGSLLSIRKFTRI